MMNFCGNCGNKLNSNEINCTNCNMSIKNEVDNKPLVIDNEKENIKKIRKSKVTASISIILALIPILLIFYCLIASGGSGDESGAGAVWWLLILYYASIGLPIAIGSLVCGVISYIIKKNKLALCSIFLAFLPFLLFLLLTIRVYCFL